LKVIININLLFKLLSNYYTIFSELKGTNIRREIFNLNTRKQQFQDGEDFELHRLGNIGEAINQVAIEEVKLEKTIVRYAAIKSQVESLVAERDSSMNARKSKLTDLLVEKYCGLCVKNSIKKFRMFADENNLRRPWDGHDGVDYAEWLRKFHGLFSGKYIFFIFIFNIFIDDS
jgi:hypothetical protein